MSSTKITYLYRDASNYKFRSEFQVEGRFNPEELKDYLIDKEYFIPEVLGLTSLAPNPPNEDDHLLHSFESVEACEVDINIMTTSREFSARIRQASEAGWFKV